MRACMNNACQNSVLRVNANVLIHEKFEYAEDLYCNELILEWVGNLDLCYCIEFHRPFRSRNRTS